MEQRQSALPDGQQGHLAERLQLLEARIRMPTVPHQHQHDPHQHQHHNPHNTHSNSAHDEISLLTTLESPAISQHSFHFDPPSNSSMKNLNNFESVVSSPQPTSRSSSVGGRLSRSLDAVNRAAEQHMQKVAALENNRCSSRMSTSSNTSFQTLKISHTAANDNKVVKESPPIIMTEGSRKTMTASGNPRALNVTSDNTNTANNKISALGGKTTKRKSTPVKKEVSTISRPRKQSSHGGANKATEGTKKRTRLQFDNHQPVANNSNSRSPKNQKAPPKNKLIHDFFTTVRTTSGANGNGDLEKNAHREQQHPAKRVTTPDTPPPSKASRAISSPASQGTLTPTKQLEQMQQSCRQWEQLCQDKDAQLKAVANTRTILQTRLQEELATVKKSYASYSKKVNTVLEDLMRSSALREAQHLREQLASDGSRLGRIVYTRAGMRSVEAWEDGTASRQLQERREQLLAERAELEERQLKAKEAARGFLAQNIDNNKENQPTSVRPTSRSDEALQGVEGIVVKSKMEALEAVESVQMHLKSLQHKLDELEQHEKQLKAEKVEHIRAWKRLNNEDSSRFKHRPKLHNRYVLMALLGKGGFSEVWRAYDLEDLEEVAVKIHQLDPRWSDEKKESYTKHVSREYEIHRNVRHPRIVSLLDVFEVDTNSFCTVLECCDGTDLETVLKRRIRLPERDARTILLQILSGMNYLSHPSADGNRQAIIHYDLKPGNILFDAQGDAKITDFGLSKIVEAHDPGQSMELTSQGAGTYWYLPPEVFFEEVTIKISSKVDVWSIGVIFYQMLYGKRPFGHSLSQDRLLSNHTILNAKDVVFPEEPQVSVAAKSFIRDCLQYDQALRPAVGQICEHPYVTTAFQVREI